MKEITIEANKREDSGKGVARKLRADGKIPAVAYGKGHDPVKIDIDYDLFHKTWRELQGENALYNLSINGETHEDKALIRDMQRDPILGHVLHVDFQYIKMDENIRMDVPVKLFGVSPGVKDSSGILQWKHRALEVTALPKDIPESIDIDISKLEIGDAIHAGDLDYPKLDLSVSDAETLVSVMAPKVTKLPAIGAEGEELEEGEEGEVEAAAEEEGGEPEVISEKKAEERQAEKGE